MSRDRYKFDESCGPCFLTCTIVGWVAAFCRPEAAKIILDSWVYLQKEGRITLFAYVIMENHLHFVAAGNELSRQVGDFKSYTARRILDLLQERNDGLFLQSFRALKLKHKTDRTYQFWQEGSHPEKILDHDMMLQKIDYTHNNPVKRGYVDRPEDWRYSSARNYVGREGLIPVTTNW